MAEVRCRQSRLRSGNCSGYTRFAAIQGLLRIRCGFESIYFWEPSLEIGRLHPTPKAMERESAFQHRRASRQAALPLASCYSTQHRIPPHLRVLLAAGASLSTLSPASLDRPLLVPSSALAAASTFASRPVTRPSVSRSVGLSVTHSHLRVSFLRRPHAIRGRTTIAIAFRPCDPRRSGSALNRRPLWTPLTGGCGATWLVRNIPDLLPPSLTASTTRDPWWTRGFGFHRSSRD